MVDIGRNIEVLVGSCLNAGKPKVGADLLDLVALAARAGGYPHYQRACGLVAVPFGYVDIGVVSHAPMCFIEYD